MGELVGLPEWLAATLFVVGLTAVWFAIGWRNTRRKVAALKLRRISPDREGFIELMLPSVKRETAQYLWKTVIFYLEPWKLTPHPDDDLLTDLPIDEDDWSMDWPRDFAELNGFHESNLPDWPEGWPVTICNFGRWLDMGPVTPQGVGN